MQRSITLCTVVAFWTLSALVTACSSTSSQAPLVPSAATQSSFQVPPGVSGDLIYITDGTGAVDIYSVKTWNKVGTLPHGVRTMCTDSAQDVILPGGEFQKILIYPRDGTIPLRKLKDSAGVPFACASDPLTGDLAVVNIAKPGNVMIYTGGVGTGKQYNIENAASIQFATYDNKGNLFVDAETTTTVSTTPLFAELPKGGSSFEPFYVHFKVKGKTFRSPMSLQWDGKYLAITDNGIVPNAVYQFSVSGSNGTEEGSTVLRDDEGTYQVWIAKVGTFQRLFATDYFSDDIRMYAYPGGGTSKRKIEGGFKGVSGVTVSLPTK